MRFGKRNLQAIFGVLLIAQWLFLSTLHNLLAFVTHERAQTMRSKVKYVLIPLHLAFAIVFVAGILG